MDPLDQYFANLDRWRHLPAYQLERRADALFSLYLAQVVAEHRELPTAPAVIPELPLRRDLVLPDQPDHRSSVKVDFAVFAADRSRVFFVELKTDVGSRRSVQDAYLIGAEAVGFRRIVQGIVDICQGSSMAQKYGHLLHALACQGCLRLPPELDDATWPTPKRVRKSLLRQVEVTVEPGEFEVEVLYVQPAVPASASGQERKRILDFQAFATHVARHPDRLSQRFAESLTRWQTRAGADGS